MKFLLDKEKERYCKCKVYRSTNRVISQSYISRFYAINRNVVSSRYVVTESVIQSLRMNNHKLLEEMFLNKDVAEAMADIIVKNQKLPEARMQINNILKAIAIKSTVEYRETEREELLAEKLRFDLPKKQQGLAGEMQQNLMGRDKYSPPQFMHLIKGEN